VTGGLTQIAFSERGYARKYTTNLDYETPNQWLAPDFQSFWLYEALQKAGQLTSGVDLFTSVPDTVSTLSYLAFSHRTSVESLSFARSLGERLRAAAGAIFEWVDDQEYERLFEKEVEPIPTGFLKQLSRFKAEPEIPLRWDEDE
jgi:hypothetical protein